MLEIPGIQYFIYSVSNPEQVVYGENVVDEDDMKSGEDIGSLIIHTYEVNLNKIACLDFVLVNVFELFIVQFRIF